MLWTSSPEWSTIEKSWFDETTTMPQFKDKKMVAIHDGKVIIFDDSLTRKQKKAWVHATSEVWQKFWEVVQTLWEDMDIFTNMEVLDVGSWKGHLWFLAHLYWAKKVDFCDINKIALEEAQKIAQYNHVEKTSAFLLPEQLEQSGKKYDRIIMNWYQNKGDEICWPTWSNFQANHLKNLVEKHLKPNGVVLIKEVPRVDTPSINIEWMPELIEATRVKIAQCLNPNEQNSPETYPVEFYAITKKKEDAIRESYTEVMNKIQELQELMNRQKVLQM